MVINDLKIYLTAYRKTATDLVRIASLGHYDAEIVEQKYDGASQIGSLTRRFEDALTIGAFVAGDMRVTLTNTHDSYGEPFLLKDVFEYLTGPDVWILVQAYLDIDSISHEEELEEITPDGATMVAVFRGYVLWDKVAFDFCFAKCDMTALSSAAFCKYYVPGKIYHYRKLADLVADLFALLPLGEGKLITDTEYDLPGALTGVKPRLGDEDCPVNSGFHLRAWEGSGASSTRIFYAIGDYVGDPDAGWAASPTVLVPPLVSIVGAFRDPQDDGYKDIKEACDGYGTGWDQCPIPPKTLPTGTPGIVGSCMAWPDSPLAVDLGGDKRPTLYCAVRAETVGNIFREILMSWYWDGTAWVYVASYALSEHTVASLDDPVTMICDDTNIIWSDTGYRILSYSAAAGLVVRSELARISAVYPRTASDVAIGYILEFQKSEGDKEKVIYRRANFDAATGFVDEVELHDEVPVALMNKRPVRLGLAECGDIAILDYPDDLVKGGDVVVKHYDSNFRKSWGDIRVGKYNEDGAACLKPYMIYANSNLMITLGNYAMGQEFLIVLDSNATTYIPVLDAETKHVGECLGLLAQANLCAWEIDTLGVARFIKYTGGTLQADITDLHTEDKLVWKIWDGYRDGVQVKYFDDEFFLPNIAGKAEVSNYLSLDLSEMISGEDVALQLAKRLFLICHRFAIEADTEVTGPRIDQMLDKLQLYGKIFTVRENSVEYDANTSNYKLVEDLDPEDLIEQYDCVAGHLLFYVDGQGQTIWYMDRPEILLNCSCDACLDEITALCDAIDAALLLEPGMTQAEAETWLDEHMTDFAELLGELLECSQTECRMYSD